MTTKFTTDHEWIDIADHDAAIVGITLHAQDALGDVVFVELPAVGKQVTKGGEAAVVESVKAASEVYAPISGEVIAVNSELEGEPAKVNAEPTGNGWFLKLKVANTAELKELMSETAYNDYVKGL
jgi:glycine cleavage system H protein